jgi:hypothetical protein
MEQLSLSAGEANATLAAHFEVHAHCGMFSGSRRRAESSELFEKRHAFPTGSARESREDLHS